MVTEDYCDAITALACKTEATRAALSHVVTLRVPIFSRASCLACAVRERAHSFIISLGSTVTVRKTLHTAIVPRSAYRGVLEESRAKRIAAVACLAHAVDACRVASELTVCIGEALRTMLSDRIASGHVAPR